MSAFVVTVDWDGCPADDLNIARALPTLLPDVDGHEVWQGSGIAVARSAFCACPQDQSVEIASQHQLDQVVCVADARLDNRDELISELRAILRTDRPSDTALILAAFERWGTDLVDRLRGEFAFVLWDIRARDLFGASDPLGGRHLRYSHWGARMAVGSRTTPVAMLVPGGTALNVDLLREFQAPEASRSFHETCFKRVLRVPPGHTLTLRNGAVAVRKYWEARPFRAERFAREADYVARFRELFENSVRSRLESLPSVAFSMSGGLDSSSVVAMAHSLSPADVCAGTVYSSVFGETPLADERAHGEAVMGMCPDYSWRPIVADNHVPFDCGRDHRPYQLDEPDLGLPSGMLHARVQTAVNDGHRVMLSGHLADQLLGDPYGSWQGLADLPWSDWSKELRYFLQKARPIPRLARAVAARSTALMGTARDTATHLGDASRAAMLGAATLRLRSMFSTLGDNAGIELRLPFADQRLVEFCWSLPLELLFRSGYSKRVLRLALGPLLPESVRTRRRNAVFGELTARGLQRNLTHLKGLVTRAEVVRMGWARPDQLRHVLENAAAGPRLGIRGYRAVAKWVGMEAFLRYRLSGALAPLCTEVANAHRATICVAEGDYDWKAIRRQAAR